MEVQVVSLPAVVSPSSLLSEFTELTLESEMALSLFAAVRKRMESTRTETTKTVTVEENGATATETLKQTTTIAKTTVTATLRGAFEPDRNLSGTGHVPELGVDLQLVRRPGVDPIGKDMVAVCIDLVRDGQKFLEVELKPHNVKLGDLRVLPAVYIQSQLNITPTEAKKTAFATAADGVQELCYFPCTVGPDGEFRIQIVIENSFERNHSEFQ